jgi:iron complex transport system ATP-binding protein
MKPAFELDDVSFSHGANRIFEGLSMEVAAGRFHGILGPNGCGKTTLLDLLAGHLRPDVGNITFDGLRIDVYPRRLLAKRLALVPQEEAAWFPCTVEQMVMMGRYPHLPRFSRPTQRDRAVVSRVLRASGIAEFRHRAVTALSGGERQRVVFARALAQEAEVLLLDEATSHLDPAHALALLSVARDRVATGGATVLAVFHNPNLAALFCDELILMGAGRVFEQGPVEEVLTSEAVGRLYHVAARVGFDAFAGARQVVFRRPGEEGAEARKGAAA